jgi:hypothetical protein
MAVNPDEEHLENPAPIQSENPPEAIIPNNDTEPINPNQAIENMEVHHHAHHGHEKKTWKNYFWEFFMLFLAVFCGSMAELQVEHYIEHQREKKYAQTLVEDLINDTIDLKYDIEGWSKAKRRADTIIDQLEKKVDLRDHRLLYKCVSLVNTNNTFLYHDRTIQQLKSSGNFRLIRNRAIADSLVVYDGWINKTITNIEDIYGTVLNPEMHNLENQLFNAKFFSIARYKEKLDAAFLESPEIIIMVKGKDDIAFQFYNKVHNYKSLTQARVNYLTATLRRATNLIELLNKEYHFD